MPYELTAVIAQYGYVAILILVFLQEIGIPSPIPNELVLLFSGYLTFTGTLYFPMIIVSAIAGDLLAGTTLFTVFYFFGQTILRQKPSWLTIPQKKIDRISLKIQATGQSGIIIGRLSPFIRGYVSVLCGLFHVSPRKFGITLILTTTVWVLTYVTAGFIIAPYFDLRIIKNSNSHLILIAIAATIILLIILVRLVRRRISTTN
ncbi:MAG: DedA family protein [Bacteroidota bacterium]|nr:DedA family protein [Bacteroidota bacterium]